MTSEIYRKFNTPAIQTSIKTQENWEIIGLPDSEFGCKETKSSSEIIKNLIERLKTQYDDYTLELQKNLDIINKEIETDIRLKSNVLKSELNLFKKSGTENIENLTVFQTEKFHFEKAKFNKSKLFCENLLEKGRNLIDQFYEDLKDIEKYRSDKFKIILKEFYDKMEKCSYKIPYEIQLFFENQILHINQTILTNLRNYKELHTDLLVIYSNDIKLMIYNVTIYSEDWKDICIEDIVTRLKSHNVSEEEINKFLNEHKDNSILKLLKMCDEYIDRLKEPPPIVEPEDLIWFNKTNSIIDDLANCAKCLCNQYETSSNQMDKSKENPFLNLKRLLSSVSNVLESRWVLDLDNKSVAAIANDTGSENVEDLWANTLKELLRFLHVKYSFLNDLEQLWSAHDQRIEDLQLAVSTELDQIIIKNDATFQEKQEMPLNVAIDSLRQELNEIKMETSMKKITSILSKMSEIMSSNKVAELKAISKYSDYVKREIELFLAAFNQFVVKYDVWEELPTLKPDLGVKNIHLYSQLKNCMPNLDDIIFYKVKILEKMAIRAETYDEKQQHQAEKWLKESVKKITFKYDRQIEYHNMREKRILLEIYDVRLAEIKKHEEQFVRHKTAVEKRLEELQKDIKQFDIKQDKEISKTSFKFIEMAELSKSSETSTSAELYVYNGDRFAKTKTNDYIETINLYSEQMLKSINQVLTSNYNFLQHIKLFHEGGNFNPKEAAMFSKKLVHLESFIQKKSSLLSNVLQTIQKKLVNSIENSLASYNVQTTMMHQILLFTENSEFAIETIQSEIRKEVYETKFKKKKIDTINERVKQLVNKNNFSNVSSVIKYCKELINHCNEYKEYLEETDTPSKSAFSFCYYAKSCKKQATPATVKMLRGSGVSYNFTLLKYFFSTSTSRFKE